MKVTGYALREALKQHELRRDTAARLFDGSLKAFPGETKESPQEVVDLFLSSEYKIVQLQVAQAKYNLAVMVEVRGPAPHTGFTMTLEQAIKQIGGHARVEKMWRSASGPKADRYGGYSSNDERDPTKVNAVATIAPMAAMKLASTAGKWAGAFRAAIALGNAVEIEIESLDPTLFE